MALSTDILLGVPYNVGGTLREVDAATVVDNVFTFSSNGKKWQRVFDGGNSVYRASWLNITGAPTDKSALVAIAVANSSIQTLEIDTTIQIDGAVDFTGKTLSVKSGGLITGTYTISNAVIEGNLTQKILDTTGILTTSKSATGKWHPTHFGATGNGSTDDYAAVNFTVGVANTNEQKSVSLIQGNYLLGTNLSVPSGVTIEFNKGAYASGSITISGAGEFDAQNSLTFGGTVVVSGVSSISGEISPQMWGAVGNDNGTSGTDDTAAFQRMWNYIATLTEKVVNIFIPAKRYYFASTVFLPKTSMTTRFIKVEGYGATFRTSADAPIWSRHPSSMSESSILISSYICIIRGLYFQGDSTIGTPKNNQVGLDLGAVYSWVVEDCFFSNLNYGVSVYFGLNCQFKNLRFFRQTRSDLLGRFGDWSGSTEANTAFNGNYIVNCRSFSLSGSFAAVELYGADQTVVKNYITEGNNPLYNFYYNYSGNTGVLINTFEDIWIESTGGLNPQNTNFYFRAAGYINLNNIQRIYPNRLFEVASNSSTNFRLNINDLPYTGNHPTTGITFFNINGITHPASMFVFRNIDNPLIITDPTNWEGGSLPVSLFVDTEYQLSGSASKLIKSPVEITLESLIVSILATQGIGVNIRKINDYSKIHTSVSGVQPLTALLTSSPAKSEVLSGSTAVNKALILATNGASDIIAPVFSAVKAAGTLSAPTALAGTHVIRIDRAEGYDGTGCVIGAFIRWQMDGTVATGRIPMSIDFNVMNSSAAIVKPLKIRASGQIELAVAPATGDLTDFILTRTSGGALRQVSSTDIIATGAQYQLGYYAAAGSKLSPLTAITASRALKSNANGLPVAFDTATEPSLTELTYVKGVTSAIQAQFGTKGLYATNGDAILTTFTVTHGFTGTPTNVQVTPAGIDSALLFFVNNITATTFDVVFTTAPIVGTNNVTFYWTAK